MAISYLSDPYLTDNFFALRIYTSIEIFTIFLDKVSQDDGRP